MLKEIKRRPHGRGEKSVKALSMLAGILIGLAVAGLAVPLTYSVVTHSWAPTTEAHHPQGCSDCGEHHGPRAMESEHQAGQCSGDCSHDRDRMREYLNRTTMVTGKIVSKDPDNGTLILQTSKGDITIIVRGRWSDGENIISYSDLLSKLPAGAEAKITIINTCHDTIHALKIIVDGQEYVMLRGPEHH